MKTQGNERLREMLAAEYALGTLRGGARRRFERWARSDDALRALALAWSERLAPLTDAMPSKLPPKRVWEAIVARLPGLRANGAGRSAAATAWWDRLSLWRGLSATFATAAIAALVFALRPQPTVEPRIVQAEPKVIEAPPKIVQAEPKIIRPEPKIVEVEKMPDAVATLVDAKSGTPVAVVFATRGGTALMVRVTTDVPVDDGKALQLWMAPSDAKSLVSLGILPAAAQGQAVLVEGADASTLARAKAFGLSLEPASGSPQPTRVLGLGPLVRLSR